MNQQLPERVHVVEIPTGGPSIVVPSATIAEVVNVSEMTSVPFSQDWMLGVLGWRLRAVSVISFEALLGVGAQARRPRSKVVIFYPLRGRREWEFFGIQSTHEPQPHTLDNTGDLTDTSGDVPDSPYIAAAINLKGKTAVIPDMEALRALFYP